MARSDTVQTNHIAATSRIWYWELIWSASYNGNLATVNWEIYARCENGTSGSTYVENYGFNGNVHETNLSYSNRFYKDSKIASGSFSLSGGSSFNVNITAHPYSGSHTSSGSWTFVLDTAVTTPTVTCLGSKGLDSITASMSVTNNGGAEIVDTYIDLFTDSGCQNIVGTLVKTSGTFLNLSPNTTYYLRANASNGTYRGFSEVIPVTTYDIARISTANNFNHGDSTSIQITNPASLSLSLEMKIGNNSILTKTGLTTGTNTISFTDTELDKIYKLYGNSSTLTVTFIVSGSGYTNSKNCIITLKGNQKTVKNNVSGSWKRGKIWTNINGTWKRAVIWTNINGNWRRCI